MIQDGTPLSLEKLRPSGTLCVRQDHCVFEWLTTKDVAQGFIKHLIVSAYSIRTSQQYVTSYQACAIVPWAFIFSSSYVESKHHA